LSSQHKLSSLVSFLNTKKLSSWSSF